jgi:hypothetical protein
VTRYAVTDKFRLRSEKATTERLHGGPARARDLRRDLLVPRNGML